MKKNNKIQIEVLAPHNTGANAIVKMIQSMLANLDLESTIITPSFMTTIDDVSKEGIQNVVESLKRNKPKITIERTIPSRQSAWSDTKLIKYEKDT